MPRHSLDASTRWIAALTALGDALGYTPEPEYDVAADPSMEAPVDLVWLRAPTDRFPLFVFEIESTAGGQLLHNAGKVLSQPTSLFEKPLFLFHVVVHGGSASNRPVVAQEMFGKFNYRIYLASQAGESTRLICDVLSQHRRVSDRVDLVLVIRALAAVIPPGVDLDRVMRHAEDSGLEATWLRAYCELALEDRRFLSHFARHVSGDLEGSRSESAQYGTWLGFAAGWLLHHGLLARIDPSFGPRCLASLRREVDDSPYRPGLNADSDNLVFGALPYVWSLTAELMSEVDGAGSWILSQIESLLGPRESRFGLALGAFAALWMLRVAASLGSVDAYGRAQEYLNENGGLNPELLGRPPDRGGDIHELDAWEADLRHDAVMVPNMSVLLAADRALPNTADPITIALQALLWDEGRDRGVALARAMVDRP